MAQLIIPATTDAAVIVPDFRNGAGEFPAHASPKPDSTEQRDRGASGAQSDTQAIAQAVIYHLRGDAAAALKALLAVDQDHRSADLLGSLGYIQTELGQYEAAAQTYSELMQLQPGMAEGWFQWGFCLYRLGHTAEALQRFDKAAGLKTDWIEVPLARAVCQLKLKHYQNAFEHADECLAIDPSYSLALFAKAVTFHVMWEFDQALVLYRQIVDGDPKCVEALMNLITLGLQQKQYDIVRQYSEQLIAFQPDIPLGVEGIAIAAFHDGDYATAGQQFARLVELVPDQVAHWLNLGVACQRQDKLSEAAAAFVRARELRPDSLYAHTYLGGALLQSGDLESACACYVQAVAKWPEKEELTLSLAEILDDLGRLEASENVSLEFCKRDPGRGQVWFRLGCVQFKRGEWNEAAASFERAVALKSDWPDAEVNLALAYYAAAQYDQSEAVLGRLLDREPEHLQGVKGLATVTLAQGRHEDSLKLHEKVLQLEGPDADVYYNCGVLAHKMHESRRAVEYYRDAIALRPDFAEALLNLGHALMDLGENEKAHSSWISALELRPEFARGYFRRN